MNLVDEKWEVIEDSHHPDCWVAIKARQRIVSTLCICKHLKDAEDAIEDEKIEKWDRKQEKGE